MRRKFYTGILFLICLTFCNSSVAQEFEFFGVIKLNDTSLISYKLLFDRVNDSIQGYTLTDFSGKHETKSNIKGYYNADKNLLSFKEYDIVYTKSPVVQEDFCFVNFNGNVRDLDKVKAFSGDFKGLYTNGEPCLDGKIVVNSGQEVRKRVEKIDKVIQRSRKFSDSVKQNIKVARVLDTLTRNIIAKNENLNIFTRDQKIKLSVYDAGKEDGDIINLFVNGKPVLQNYTVTHTKKHLEFKLESPSTLIKVEAVSEGTSSPNTVRLEVEDSRNFVRTITNLQAGETAAMTIIKK